MRVFVIAECGVNHNGSLQVARHLIDSAKAAGADGAKFQLFESKKLWGDDRIRHLELTYRDMERLHEHCRDIEIEFMCTPFGVAEMLFLKPLLKRVKIASGCIGRIRLLEAAAESGLPVILSTGMSTMADIDQATHILKQDLTLLHCTSAYPCPISEVNLSAMAYLRSVYDCSVGYSDHTQGITVAIAAAALGATVLEKHLTLDRMAVGPDHRSSIEPREFTVMVSAIRTVEEALGDGEKRVMPSEEKLKAVWHGH